jgi:hypothetical protein
LRKQDTILNIGDFSTKQEEGFWGKILVFGWKITNFENCVLFMR